MGINLGLSVNDVVSVNVVLSPTAAQQRNFGSLLILGDSPVIDTGQRYRLYTSLTGVAADFGSSAPEYLAAALFFGQSPTPANLYIGRWARTATNGILVGAVLSAAQQAIANFTAAGATGSISISIDGVVKNLTNINLSAVGSLNAVATALQTALAGSATCTWDATNSVFHVVSATTGAASAVTFGSVQGTGNDISALMGLQVAQGGYIVAGIVAETALACVTALANMTNNWYGLMFASSTMPVNADYVAVAGFIQGLTVSRIFGVTSQEANALLANNATDIGSLLQALLYSRTFVQYSSSSLYACAAIFGVAFTTNFNGANTLYTLKFKQETGVAAETLTETQAAALNQKNINVFVNYNNATAILQQGTMASGTFFDVIHGCDWLQNAIQTNYYNTLYLSPTKVPQTDSGVNQLVGAVTQACEQGVINGLLAPGVWNGPSVGVVVTGQTLARGYYISAPPVASQTVAARGARQAPVIQAAVKLAGAIHGGNVIVNVNQ
jgi:hypothetical protein